MHLTIRYCKNTRYGPSDRIRTCGLVVPNHARYQLRNTRMYLDIGLIISFPLPAVKGFPPAAHRKSTRPKGGCSLCLRYQPMNSSQLRIRP